MIMIRIIKHGNIDISEKLFNVLLLDRATRKNICWATEHYISYGPGYYPQEPIKKDLIMRENENLAIPRIAKDIKEQLRRTKDKGEVFTPSWICNEQNNLIDEAWFGRKNVFNQSKNNSWITNKKVICFSENKTWRKYVDSKRIEISCGEAPYLVSRYDTVTGKAIPIEDRIGLLDRKLRVINENTVSENDWFFWTKRAYESIYGYEYQGDSLLIARENLLYTFIENMNYKFGHEPNERQLMIIAKIISWNIWQMDAITMSVPYSERPSQNKQMTIFDFIEEKVTSNKEPVPCKIYDWRSKRSLEFKSLLNGELNL